MNHRFLDFVKDKSSLVIIQAENPDGDSLGSALALSEILADKAVTLYCPVEIPKYLRYFADWSLVSTDFNYQADGYIIVDTAANVLLSKSLADPAIAAALSARPVLVLDHHETPDDLSFPHQSIIAPLPACCDLIFQVAKDNFAISPLAAKYLLAGILSDTLGLSSSSVSAETFRTVAALTDLGASVAEIDDQRREFMKKSPRILDYKADLIKRIEYSLDGRLATIHIPWEDIREFSDEYNPGVLILEELRLVEGVLAAVAVKTYPDGKVTGKIRAELPIAKDLAAHFGGGGHQFAAGFRTYDLSYQDLVKELIPVASNLIDQTTNLAEPKS